MTAFSETTRAGFRVLGLRTAAIELRCAPELGGRVFSLVSRRTGREWLWRQPGELFQPADPRDFGTGTFAGLDECLPTVGACVWPDGRALADHGNIWSRAWTTVAADDTTVTLTVDDPVGGLRFTRGISVEGRVVRFDYTLENTAAVAAPALWSMHPLFTLTAGDRLELPSGVRQLTVESASPVPGPAGSSGRPAISFPEPSPGVRLDALELSDLRHGYLKCFTPALPAGSASAALTNPPAGDRLEVHWATTAAPHLGLWLTRGGYRGWHHVALEPTNVPFDRASVAATDPRFAPAVTLAPGAGRKWWVEWRVS